MMNSDKHASMKKLILALCILATPAFADEFASSWSKSLKSEARLISGGDVPGTGQLAGVEIHLAPNTLTYWRNPGEAGVPPIFNFEGSENLQAAKVLYPAPSLLSEGGVIAYGYEDRVVFPILVTAQDAAQPVKLRYKLDYATCEKICVPAKADGELLLQKQGGSAQADIQRALARVPKTVALGDTAPLSLLLLTRIADAATPTFDVMVAAGETADLFAEGPDAVYLAVQKYDERHFTVKAQDVPADMKTAQLKLTLVTKSAAIETLVDVSLKP